MSRTDPYQIAFTGLAPGTHEFDFQVGDTFFEQVEDTEILAGTVAVSVIMAREERMLDLHFTLDGKVTVSCDRCNEPVEVEVTGKERLIIKLGDRYFEESEDVQVIPDTAHVIALGPFIYEYIHLLMPVRRVHPEDEQGNSQCNPEVIKKLKELAERHMQDPRWEVLNQLKKKDNQ